MVDVPKSSLTVATEIPTKHTFKILYKAMFQGLQYKFQYTTVAISINE